MPRAVWGTGLAHGSGHAVLSSSVGLVLVTLTPWRKGEGGEGTITPGRRDCGGVEFCGARGAAELGMPPFLGAVASLPFACAPDCFYHCGALGRDMAQASAVLFIYPGRRVRSLSCRCFHRLSGTLPPDPPPSFRIHRKKSAVVTSGLPERLFGGHVCPRSCSEKRSARAVWRTGVSRAVRGTGVPRAVRGTGVPRAVRGTGVPRAVRGTGVPRAVRGTGLPKRLLCSAM